MKIQIAAVTIAATSTAAVWWLSASSQPMEARVRIEPARTETTASVSASANSTSPSSPVDWSQIESSDYRQYVANLRAIVCPEETALQAYDLKSTTIREANQILAEPNLSSNQRAERLRHLRQRAEERWELAVGTNAFRMIHQLGGTKWMNHLGEP